MSLFTNQLEIALENAKITRLELSERCGINYRTLSNYATGRTPPDQEAVRQICAALAEEDRGPLLVAHATDVTPPELRHLLIIEERSPTLHEQPAPYLARKLPAPTARAIEVLAAAAGENEEWRKAVLALADLVEPTPDRIPHPLEDALRAKAANGTPKPPSGR